MAYHPMTESERSCHCVTVRAFLVDMPPCTGMATVRADGRPHAAPVWAWPTRIGGRCMAPERAEKTGRRNGVPGHVVVRLHRERVVTAADPAE